MCVCDDIKGTCKGIVHSFMQLRKYLKSSGNFVLIHNSMPLIGAQRVQLLMEAQGIVLGSKSGHSLPPPAGALVSPTI